MKKSVVLYEITVCRTD